MRRDEERKMREEGEDYLRSENIGVGSILQNYDNDRFAQKQKIKVDMKPRIRNIFTFNLRKEEYIDLTNTSYCSVMKFIRVHITVNYILEDDNVSDIYIESFFDEVIEESVLKNDLSLVLEKTKERMRSR